MTLRMRSEIEDKYKWNAPSVFETAAAWEKAFGALKDRLPELATFQGRLAESPDVLMDCLTLREELGRALSKLYVFASMNRSVDANDDVAMDMSARAGAFYAHFAATDAFFDPELLAIGKETINQWCDAHNVLAGYRHLFDDLFRQAKHVRSAEVEMVLGMASDAFQSARGIADRLTDADMVFSSAIAQDGSEHVVAQSTFQGLLRGSDRAVRASAWDHYADQYVSHKHTLTAGYLTSVKQNIFQAQVRGYDSVLHAVLEPRNIPVEVFHNLLDTFKKHLPQWHRYWRVRRQMLGVETLHPYDIWAPLSSNPPDASYEQSVAWIASALAPLGQDYVNTMRKGCLEDRWVDVYPNEGKRDGAFSSGTYDTIPFIMMSYTENLSGMSTLAHELGHSMHSYLANQTQPYQYHDYSMFLAEVASNFNQAMTRAYLFEENDDPDFQITLVEEAMENFHRYFFIMPTLSRFEYEVHETLSKGGNLSADDLIDLMVSLFEEGYGGEMHIDRERVGMTWAQFGHLYVPFYTFQYATGISGANAFANRILANEDGAVNDYLGFLKAGSSQYATDVLRNAGLDLTKSEAVEEAFSVLSGLIDRLENLAE